MDKETIYNENKSAKCGTEMVCPVCGAKFIKKQYSQAFCSGKCKDAYHNAKGDRHKKDYYKTYSLMVPKRNNKPKTDKQPKNKMRCRNCENWISAQGLFSDYMICSVSREIKRSGNRCSCKNHFALK